MRWSEVIHLVGQVPDTNEYGHPIERDGDPRQVFANRLGVRQSEFYQAMQTGLKPEAIFEVRSSEYQGEPKLLYAGTAYTIIRTYDKGEKTELICGGLVGD